MGFANENGMFMPVAPAYGYGNNGGGFGGFAGDGWWIIVLLLCLGGGWGNGFGNYGGGVPLYSMNTNNDVQRGFDQSAVISGINGLNTAVNGVSQAVCNSTGTITAAMSNGFAQAEIANNARQMADMNQNFAMQSAMNSGFNALQSQLATCCCDNRLASADLKSTVLSENCADRAALSDALNVVNQNMSNGFQRILDTMCQRQIDDLQRALTAKDTQIAMLGLKADNIANTDRIVANNEIQTAILKQALNPTPVPAYPAQYPSWNGSNCNCNNYSCCA